MRFNASVWFKRNRKFGPWLTTLEWERSWRMAGVTLAQKSMMFAMAWQPSSDSGWAAAACSQYTVHSWHRWNAWNSADMCTTDSSNRSVETNCKVSCQRQMGHWNQPCFVLQSRQEQTGSDRQCVGTIQWEWADRQWMSTEGHPAGSNSTRAHASHSRRTHSACNHNSRSHIPTVYLQMFSIVIGKGLYPCWVTDGGVRSQGRYLRTVRGSLTLLREISTERNCAKPAFRSPPRVSSRKPPPRPPKFFTLFKTCRSAINSTRSGMYGRAQSAAPVLYWNNRFLNSL